jgi:hypothetical protein
MLRHPAVRAAFAASLEGYAAGWIAITLRGAQERAPQDDGSPISVVVSIFDTGFASGARIPE